ncbi:unnamed protein product [Allacma fusca]|uniref:RING-type E3 ubiquitin transferase n=1 Tax=Allacma fusca TaxID=39272 RepID=A0A8J2PD45_9HEXA|nr:unnamed protein product [Allacma fusca]
MDDSQGQEEGLPLSHGQFNPLDFLQLLGVDASRRGGHPSSPTTPGGASGISSSSSTGSTPTTLAGAATALAAAAATSNSQSQPGRGGRRGHFSFVIDGHQLAGGGFGGGGGGSGNAAGGAAGAGGSDNPMENMILSFIADLITGLGGGQHFPGIPLSGNINLGDYAWGSQGLDAIVTQLMNNIEGTGPAPLTDEKLSALNRIQITQEHVDGKLQCSVCWEDFCVGENVIRLDCEHIYHPDCILPWLKLHGTCPVCRKDLNQPEQMDVTSGTNPDSINDNVSGQQQPQVTSSRNTQSNPRALQDDMEFD